MNCESTEFDYQDVLLLIGLKKSTGELTLESGNNIGHMLFYRGRILQSMSPYSRAIGDLLVEEGLITEMELIETLQLQKKSSVSPIGSLLLKTGKVSFAVIERLVHEQIRLSVKEFKTWENIRLNFQKKEIEPSDGIHLMIHEFLPAEILKNASCFLSTACASHDHPAAPTSKPAAS